MFYRVIRLASSALVAIATITAPAAAVFPMEPPARSHTVIAPAQLAAGANLNLPNAARALSPDQPARLLEIQRPSSIEPRPVARPLADGSPQTIIVQVSPSTLIANSGATAIITATVFDMTGVVVEGANLLGIIAPSSLGQLGLFPPTNANGQTTSTWTAGNTLGTGTIQVGNGVVSDTANITLTADVPFTLTLSPASAAITAGTKIAYTAIATDTFGNGLGDVTGSTIFSITPSSGGTFTGNTVTPTVRNTYTVNGSDGSALDTATLIVNSGALNRLVIASDDSGTPINAQTMTVYDTLTVYAFGYDVNNNFLGPQTVMWSGTSAVAGNLNPTSGNTTTFTPVAGGTGTIIATSGAISDTTGLITVQAPVLRISKADSPDPITPGSLLRYTIVYTNNSSFAAQNVRITETYPLSTSYVIASPLPDASNNVWSIGTLAAGVTGTINVTMTVAFQMPVGSVLANTVQVGAAKANTVSYTTTTQVVAPNLQLTKTANPVSPAANGLLTYTLNYTNNGSSYAANVVVTDAVPLNTTFQSCVPQGCSLNGNIVTWNPGYVPQQTSNILRLVVHVNNNLPNGTLLTNSARIASVDSFPVLAVLTNTVLSAPNVTLTKSDGVATAAAGAALTYQLSYANTGNAPAHNVVITDRIPANVNFLSCATCIDMGSGVYSFTPGTVNASQSGVVTLSVRVNSPLPAGVRAITNTAYIRTTTPSDNPSDNVAQDIDSISTVPVLALNAAYDASTPYPGKLITYTLRYTNTSAMDTTGVVISVTRSPYVSVVPTGWSSSGGYDTRTIGNLAAGQTGTLTYVVSLTSTFTAAMNVFNNTFLIHDGGPGGLPPATKTVPTNVGVPDLFIQSVSVPPAVLPGKKFTATLTIRNGGTGRACNPSGCLSFYVDAFADPASPPPSYPYVSDGAWFAIVPVIMPGQAVIAVIPNIVFTSNQRPIVYFKVDNFACPGSSCLPPGSRGGLVPESNEYNNVFGPLTVPRYVIDLPVIKKKTH